MTATTSTNETISAGRTVGVVATVAPRDAGKAWIYLRDAENIEYFAHKSGWPPGLFERVAQGDAVSFRRSSTSKGWRAFEVQNASGEEAAAIAVEEENRGNR